MRALCLLLLLFHPFAFAEQKGAYVCEKALINASPVFSTYNLSLYSIGANDGHKYAVQAFKPRYGNGRLLFLMAKKIDLESPLPSLLKAILKFPLFFSRYEMVAEGTNLVIPDADRLNIFLSNGVQFDAVPFYKAQYYDELYFQQILAEGFIPIGTTGDAFYHDRMEEHLIGALILPRVLFARYLHYNQFDQALTQATFPQTENEKSLVRSYLALRSSPGRNWDTMTSLLGYYIVQSLPAPSEPILKQHIQELFTLLRRRADSLTVGPSSAFRDEIAKRDDGQYISDSFKKNVMDLEKKFAIEKIPDEVIWEEALRIISKVHGAF